MSVAEMIVYELVLVRPASRKILAIESGGRRSLPRIRIPRRTRAAEQLQKAIAATFGLQVIVLDFLRPRENVPPVAVAELLYPNTYSGLSEIPLEDISADMADKTLELSDFLDRSGPLSQPGWIDEAIAWLESATQRKLSSKSHIEQLNAGGAFSLLRFQMDDGNHYWLKATGEPNAHERSITCFLSELCGSYLPELISTRPAWNAWLMSEETTPAMQLSTDPATLFQQLANAVKSMAELQMRTAGCHSELFNAGAFDQRIEAFEKHSEAVFDFLEEAMSLQVSTKAPRLSTICLRENRTIFGDVCGRMKDLGLPHTIVHGDLNVGNIFSGPGQSKFIDWCEAYVGNPLIALQNLLRLNQTDRCGLRAQIDQALKRRYRDTWTKAFDPVRIERGFHLMPVLTIFSSLFARGDWLTSPKRDDPRLQSYSRTLARHLDCALREPGLREALCG